MGHRKKSAPRRGSLGFRPRARKKYPVPRIKFWPEVDGAPRLLGFAGYKAGMAHMYVLEDNEDSRWYGKEVFVPITIIDTPPLTVLAIRAYEKTPEGLRSLCEVWAKDIPEDVKRRHRTASTSKIKPEDMKKLIDRISVIRAIVSTNSRKAGIRKKKPEIFEIEIGGGTVEERVNYALDILGKEVNVDEVFKEGEYVDVFSITKGKGFAGAVKRFHVKILDRKSNKTRRGVACIGPWKPTAVMYTVPRPGQLGYWQRMVRNLRVMKIGDNGKEEATVKGGFLRYGVVPGKYVMISGSVPGPAKRLVKIRVSARKLGVVKPPQITGIVLASQQ